MTHRFFIASETVYEQARAALDAAFGYPSDFAKTSFSPASEGVRAKDGRMLLGVRSDWADAEPAASMLAQMLAAGAVQEITAAEYEAAVAVAPVG